MQKNMTDRTPGSYDDFVAYLGTVRTEEELFSRLTYWFAGQNRPEDVLSRSELVEARAKELGFWQGLTFRMERWLTDGKSELEAVGREEFQSRIAEDYAAYREKADAARARFRDRRRAAPFNFTPDCLQNVPIQNVSWLVDGLLPMGCSDRTYIRAYGNLIKSGEIIKKNIRQQDGKNQWYSFLYCSETSGKVPIN